MKFTVIFTTLILIILVILVLYFVKNKNKNGPYETFYYFLHTHMNIDIQNKQRSIMYKSKTITGFFGNHILFNIKDTNDESYTIMRYPEFRNEILRHSKSNFIKYFDYIKLQYLNKRNKSYILDFTGFHGHIDNKVFLWIKLKNKYGRKTANKIMGTTYIIPKDKKKFLLEYKPNQKYILKNSFGGARSSLEIIQNKEDIIRYFDDIRNNPEECEDAVCHNNDKYNIIQSFIEPTFLIKNYKFGLRFFLILINTKKRKSVYIYKDGYCYYGEEPYKTKSSEMNGNVVGRVSKTKAWRERNNLPESYLDFKDYVKKNVQDGISKTKHLEKTLRSYCNKIISSQCEKELFNFDEYENVKSFCIYGMDVEIDSEFNPYIFEANVYFTRFNSKERLGIMMSKMYNDIFYKLELVPKEKLGMWQVY